MKERSFAQLAMGQERNPVLKALFATAAREKASKRMPYSTRRLNATHARAMASSYSLNARPVKAKDSS